MNVQMLETVNAILNPAPNWEVKDVDIQEAFHRIIIELALTESATFICEKCNKIISQNYQSQMKSFRYLKIMGYETFLTVEQPWFECTHSGWQSIPIPWELDVKESLCLSNTI